MLQWAAAMPDKVYGAGSNTAAWHGLLQGGARGWEQAACAGEAHTSRTHPRQGTCMHALQPDITALHVCLVKCMRGGGAWGHAARLQHGEVRIWCSGASVNGAVMRLH